MIKNNIGSNNIKKGVKMMYLYIKVQNGNKIITLISQYIFQKNPEVVPVLFYTIFF